MPFMHGLDWYALDDAWSTSGNNPPKHTASISPMYTTAGETGYSSPSVVNDVVCMSTSQLGLYAFDAATGLCLWSADPITSRRAGFIRGPVIYRDYVVFGTRTSLTEGSLKIYTL